MFETKVIVAPNSPSERANASNTPTATPGKAKGNVTVRNTRQREAPSVRAAHSSFGGTASSDSLIARTIKGTLKIIEASESAIEIER